MKPILIVLFSISALSGLAGSKDELAPLFLAALKGDPATFHTHFTAGVNPNQKLPRKYTVSRESWKKPAVAEVLRMTGVATELGGNSLLMAAVIGGHGEIVKTLLARGARVDHRNTRRETALHLAAERGNLAIVTQLLDASADPTALTRNKVTPLMSAAASGKPACFAHLLSLGLTPDAVDREKRTLMHYAALGGSEVILERVAELGVSVTERDRHGKSPLMFAAEEGSFDGVLWLADHGADLTEKTAKGDTVLHIAARSNASAIQIAGLVERGLDVNAPGLAGTVPLMSAILANRPDAAQGLMRMGADPDREDQTGNSPLSYVHFLKNRTLYRSICDAGWDGAALHCSARIGDVPGALRQVEKGVNIDTHNPAGETTLFVAISERQNDMVRSLLEAGADPNAPTAYKWTPLYLASWLGDSEMVARLLAEGAEPDMPIAGGDTPLGAAVAKDRYEIAQTLIDAGATVLYFSETGQRATIRAADLPRLADARRHALESGRMKRALPPFWLKDYRTRKVYRYGGAEMKPPIFVEKVTPDYPPGAKDAEVILETILGSDGVMRDITIKTPYDNWSQGLEIAAIGALRQWKFIPAEMNGEPVDIRMLLKIDIQQPR